MADVDLRSLERKLRADPSDLTASNQLAKAYARKGMFAIEETDTDYILYNVEHVRIVRNEPVRDVIVNITLSKNLLGGGVKHIPEKWVSLAKEDGYEIPDTLTIYSICRALYLNFKTKHIQQTKITEARNTLLEYFRKYIITNTRIIYDEKKPDNIIHNFNTTKQTSITTEMRFNNDQDNMGFVQVLLCDVPLQTRAMLGTDNINEANQVLKWATNTRSNPLLWLLPLPKRTEMRQVNLGGSYYLCRFCINTYGNINVPGQTFNVN